MSIRLKSIWDEIYLIPSLIPAHHVNSERTRSDFTTRRSAVVRLAYPIDDRAWPIPTTTTTTTTADYSNVKLRQCRYLAILRWQPITLSNGVSTYSFHTLPFKNTNTLFNVQLIDFRTKNSRWTESAFFFILSPMYDQLLHSTYEIVLYTLYAITMKRRCSHRIDPIV